MRCDFRNDKPVGDLGELLSMIATIKHRKDISEINRSNYNCANSTDMVISELGARLRVDYKVDAYALKTGNFCCEIISQFKMKHIEHIKQNKAIYEKRKAIFYGDAVETLDVLNEMRKQIIEGKKLKRFTTSELGWAIKDNESSRSIIVFSFANVRGILQTESTKNIIEGFFKNLYCLNQVVGCEQIQTIRECHDSIFNKLNINKYCLWIIKKDKLLEFLKDDEPSRAISVSNGSYQTLSYLIPFYKFENTECCSKYSWKR